MKKIILLLGICLNLLANDILVFSNEYQVLELDKKVKKLIVGNKDIINISLLSTSSRAKTKLKIFGKTNGNTSILIVYRDNSIENFHVYVNENLGFIQKMVNVIEPSIRLSRVGNGSTVIAGEFKDPHNKTRILNILKNAGVDSTKLMDLTETVKVNKMIRTKLYLVEINNNRAKDLGGVTGLGFFNKYLNLAVNPDALNAATFSGFLLDNTAAFTATTGNSVVGTLNFLEQKGIAKILDDTVLITTEDKNASFRVGGEVYIPVGLTQNIGFAPTIQVEEKEYGLRLTLTSHFMEKDKYMNINVDIKDSEFDTNKDHDVQLGENIFVPSFVSKNMLTNVAVKSGQVIALGGRLHTEDADTEDKVPLLGDIPIIGELFKHTIRGKKTNDLIFFLVPEIVDANENLDDTKFYKNFKDSSNIFHDAVLDMNDSKEQIIEDNATEAMPIIEVEETNATTNEIDVAKEQLDENASDKMNTTVESNTTVVPVNVVTELNATDELNATQPTAAVVDNNQTIQTVVPQKNIQKSQENIEQMYAVTTKKVFLREAPGNGKIVNVWILGHKFTSKESKIVDGRKWYKVDENCREKCKPAAAEYWLTGKFVSEL